LRVLVSIVTDATVAYWVSGEGGPAEPLASVANRGMSVDQIAEIGVSLISALSLNGAAPAPKREPKTRAAPQPKGRRAKPRKFVKFTEEMVLTDIGANPGTTAQEGAARLGNDASSGRSSYDRLAKVANGRGIVAFGERNQEGVRGRNPRAFWLADATYDAPVTAPDDEVAPAATLT